MEKHFVLVINQDGIYQTDDIVEELTELTVETPIPRGMYAVPGVTPRWDGSQWLEVVIQPVFVPSVSDKIEKLKSQLATTDYKAIKYAEGWISEADYAPIKAERQSIRDRINELQAGQA